MNVSLTPELEKLINEKVKSGMYHSASEVIREALRVLHGQEELRKIKLEALRRDVAKGIEQAERGGTIPAEKVFASIKKRNKALRRTK